MDKVVGDVVAGLIADLVELHHQHEATRALFLALARAAARNGSISQSDITEAIEAVSGHLSETHRLEASRRVASISDEICAFAFGGETHIIPAPKPSKSAH